MKKIEVVASIDIVSNYLSIKIPNEISKRTFIFLENIIKMSNNRPVCLSILRHIE